MRHRPHRPLLTPTSCRVCPDLPLHTSSGLVTMRHFWLSCRLTCIQRTHVRTIQKSGVGNLFSSSLSGESRTSRRTRLMSRVERLLRRELTGRSGSRAVDRYPRRFGASMLITCSDDRSAPLSKRPFNTRMTSGPATVESFHLSRERRCVERSATHVNAPNCSLLVC